MKTLAIVAILALGCATSASTESRFSPYAGGQAELDLAKRAILASLKDPESAIFGSSATFYQRHSDGAKFLCIYVSSKNSIGSYVSMHPATVSFKDGKVVDVDRDLVMRAFTVHLDDLGACDQCDRPLIEIFDQL